MRPTHRLPTSVKALAGKVAVIEAYSGEALRARLSEALGGYQAEQYWTRYDAPRAGLWSGVREFLETIRLETRHTRPSLLEKHRREFAVILPELRTGVTEMESLTELAAPSERVRNYAVDRINRVLHGLIDLTAEWRGEKQKEPWVLVCQQANRAGVLAARWLRELHRRAGEKTNLFLVLVVEPGAIAPINSADVDYFFRWNLPQEIASTASPNEFGRLAAELEYKVGQSPLLIERHVSELIYCWANSSQPERAARWQAAALGLYNHLGCYEDAIQFIDPVLSNLESICDLESEDGFWKMTRWNIVGNIYGCYNSVGRPDLAYAVVTEALGRLQEPTELARAHYVLAMSHARFLPQRNNHKAEESLLEALNLLERADAEDEAAPFLTSFLLNGLAYVRHRQGRPAEAIDLCKRAYNHLSRHLDGNAHRLHRSVLFYNIAQVYGATGASELAIEHYSAAIEMDPNYSEYHNERGSILLRLGRLAEAEADYIKALELSSPYYEVWANLGQCYSFMGRREEAIGAYDVAIDLNPAHPLAWIGRAQALQGLDRFEEALRDYTSYLALDRDQPLALSNRAAVYWKLGRIGDALVDLQRAVEMDPANDLLNQNLSWISEVACAAPLSETM